MKSISLFASAAVAALCCPARSQTVIHIIGSQEDRPSVQTAISNLLSPSSGGPTGNGWHFQGSEGGGNSSHIDAIDIAMRSRYGVWSGSFNGEPLIIKVTFPGVLSAISALAGSRPATFPATPGFTSSPLPDPAEAGESSLADFGFSSVFQSSTPFEGTYNGHHYEILRDEIVGITPIAFFGSAGFPRDAANVTNKGLQLLYRASSFDLFMQSANHSRDAGKIIYSLSPGTELGARYCVVRDIGLTGSHILINWDPRTAAPPTFGGTIPSHTSWPPETIGETFNPGGHGGFSEEAGLAPYLTATLLPDAYRGVIHDPEEGTFSVYPDATAGYYIGYLASSDARSSVAGPYSYLPEEKQAVPLAYNGVPLTDDNVRNGQYSAWLYNRIIKPPTGLTGLKLVFADALRDRIRYFDATAGGGIRDDHRFFVTRYSDGGLIVPNPEKLIDSDGDGLTDAYEWDLIHLDPDDNLNIPADVIPPSNPAWADMDNDNDGTPNGLDATPNDRQTSFPRSSLPRYAAFIVDGSGRKGTLRRINDQGIVLYLDGYWQAGSFHPWPAHMLSFDINNLGEVIGTSLQSIAGFSEPMKAAAWWMAKAPNPSPITSNGIAFPEIMEDDEISGPRGPFLSDDGLFPARGRIYNSESPESPVTLPLSLWNLPRPGRPISAGSLAGEDMISNVASHELRWGPGRIIHSLSPPLLKFTPLNVIPHQRSTGGRTLIALPPAHEITRYGQILNGSEWVDSTTYGHALDIADNGTAIGRNHNGFICPILLNDTWTELSRTAPGLVTSWSENSKAANKDTTPNGWIVAERPTDGDGEDDYEQLALLPIRAQGRHLATGGTVMTTAVGVDDFSIGSFNPDPDSDTDANNPKSVKDRIWIMAPQEGSGTNVTFKSPLNEDTPLTISAPGIRFNYANSQVILQSPETLVNISADHSAASGQDITATLKFGNQASASLPIGFKVMKRRTVKVTVYKVETRLPNGSLAPLSDAIIPTAQELSNYLYDLYSPQINTDFDIRIVDQKIPVQWDLDGDGNLATGNLDDSYGHSLEQTHIATNVPADTQGSHIRIFLMGCPSYLRTGEVYGITAPSARTCFVLGSIHGQNNNKTFLMNTVAHEIGHILFGPGHPDLGLPKRSGPARLPGTIHRFRLMAGGDISNAVESRLITKREWDAAERWFENEEANGRSF